MFAKLLAEDEEHMRILGFWTNYTRRLQCQSVEAQRRVAGSAKHGGLLQVLHRLLRRQPVARRGRVSAPFQNKPETPRDRVCHPGVRPLLHMQEGMHRHDRIFLTVEVHSGDEVLASR